MTAPPSAQQKLPLAFLHGEAVIEKPADLYIPPDALEVVLASFEGPLDLLLYLIKKHKLDLLTLSVCDITEQYMRYVELMEAFELDRAGDYLVMAALLAQIKSRMLLPVHEELEEEDDPRAVLIKRLQEYEQFKQAAETLDTLPRLERDIFTAHAQVTPNTKVSAPLPNINLQELTLALSEVMARSRTLAHHHIAAEQLSTRERMSDILTRLQSESAQLEFGQLFKIHEGRAGVVVTFIALLELLKEGLISCQQSHGAGQLYVYLQ